jgi:Autotransporter beta-domain
MTFRYSRCCVLGLFSSTAVLFFPTAALADGGTLLPTDDTNTPVSGVASASDTEPSPLPRSTLTPVETPTITINNNLTPTDARDPDNLTGIGQIVTDGGGGSVGLCTGTLINRRTVLFAAHCVNNAAATSYGANTGGTGIAIGFETNTRANAPGQPDEFVNWLLGSGAGPGQYRTNTAQSLYNISQVFWNPGSRSAASCVGPAACAQEADIATAVLDTPTRNIPTWTMLFSPLGTPNAIDPATGTGYHVSLAGYGRNGTGTTGAVGNDFRRRTAENMLGALTSISARNLFLFGTAGTPARPQLLYWLDFDDPARGTATANTRDFNSFRDNALPREGSAAESGDSGSPLIIDQAFASPTIIGVLSGATTFFAGQPVASYGTQAFYQPLFLYWDWIVANNPYRYVAAAAGNRNWEDATAWLTELDPAYRVLLGGALTNGLPANIGGGLAATSPQFGELCFQTPLNTAAPPATNECQNVATGLTRNGVPNTAAGGTGGITDLAADAGMSVTARPAATLANGLPGATNFVPNNSDGVRATGVAARYYDVTLRNSGTITLNSNVTIDNFGISGATSGLVIAPGASLTSLVEVNQLTGTTAVNGTLTSIGDYFLMSGLLSGNGRVNAPFVTSIIGNIAPGTLGTVGTLTIAGNLVLSSGSSVVVDLGAAGVSDRLAIVTAAPGSGFANIGGRVVLSPTSGTTLRSGDIYTILTAQGGVTGTFSPASSLSAILTPRFIYNANSVQLQIVAGSYGAVASTPVQRAYAALLDRNRGVSSVAPLYDFLDLQDAGTIGATLESWAPRTEALKGSIATAAIDNMTRFYRSRLASMDLANGLGGSVTILGNPMHSVTRLSASSALPKQREMSLAPDGQDSNGLPETMSAFFAGGYLDGKSDSMATAIPFGGDDNFDGYYLAAGFETELSKNAALGFGLSYTEIDGGTGGLSQDASGKLLQGTLYGKMQSSAGLTLDTQLSAAMFRAATDRNTAVGVTTYRLQSRDDTLALSAEVGLGKMFSAGTFEVGPRIAMRASRIEFTPTVERGGPTALAFNRGRFDSLQAMAGLTLSGGMKFKPYASTYFVHEFEDKPAVFGANFVSGVALPAAFALAGQDKNWFEASAGIAFGSDTLQISLGADTTIGRSDVSNQSYRGTVTFRF